MELLSLAYAAISLALLIVQLLDYDAEQERMPSSRRNVMLLSTGPTGVPSSPAAKTQAQYDRAA